MRDPHAASRVDRPSRRSLEGSLMRAHRAHLQAAARVLHRSGGLGAHALRMTPGGGRHMRLSKWEKREPDAAFAPARPAAIAAAAWEPVAPEGLCELLTSPLRVPRRQQLPYWLAKTARLFVRSHSSRCRNRRASLTLRRRPGALITSTPASREAIFLSILFWEKRRATRVHSCTTASAAKAREPEEPPTIVAENWEGAGELSRLNVVGESRQTRPKSGARAAHPTMHVHPTTSAAPAASATSPWPTLPRALCTAAA